MAEVVETAEPKICSNPGCDQPGTSACSACKTTFYCGPICQTADWPHHKEECDGHLRKVGKTYLTKATAFAQQQNWMQSLRYAKLGATKLKQLKDRRLETVSVINDALTTQYNALNHMARYQETLECAEERYTLWAMNHMRHPGSIYAAFALIQSSSHLKKYEDAERYARHAYFMIAEMTDNFIPAHQYPHYLAQAIFGLAHDGGIPPAENQTTGKEAIALARKAVELHIQLHGTEHDNVAIDLCVLAEALDYFNDVDDDEILCLIEQSIAIHRRLSGDSFVNVAIGEKKLGCVYCNRAERAVDTHDLHRQLANYELALPHFIEAARIHRVNNHVGHEEESRRFIARAEEKIREVRNAITAVTAAEAALTRG